MATQKVIDLLGLAIRKTRKNGVAALTPGSLVDVAADGTLVAHATAGGLAVPRFILEQAESNKGIADAVPAGDTAQYAVFQAGSEVNALVAASASAIVVGDFVESAGDGTVRKVVPLTVVAGTADNTVADVTATFSQTILNNNFADVAARVNRGVGVVGQALEAVDNSAGGTAVRIRIETV